MCKLLEAYLPLKPSLAMINILLKCPHSQKVCRLCIIRCRKIKNVLPWEFLPQGGKMTLMIPKLVKFALTPKKGAPDDIVESVDMEMSSDEEIETETAKPTSSVSFSLTPHSRPLGVSPLKEKEEAKMKKLSVTLTPPPRLPEPPPLPDVNEIFPELDSGEEDKDLPTRIPSPPIPPPPPLPIPIHSIPSIQEARPPPNMNPSGQGFHIQRPQRGFLNPRFNNQRQRFNQPWQNNINNNQNTPRPRHPPMVGPRFRQEGFRGRPNPWFNNNRGNPRQTRFTGW